jgi:hypothetical protein
VGGFRDVAGGCATFAGDRALTPSEAKASKAVRSRREAAFLHAGARAGSRRACFDTAALGGLLSMKGMVWG